MSRANFLRSLLAFALTGPLATKPTSPMEAKPRVSTDAVPANFPIAPQCSAGKVVAPALREQFKLAVDAGMSGHVVVATGAIDAAFACAGLAPCQTRKIAWNVDVREQMMTILLHFPTLAIDNAGWPSSSGGDEPGWRYSAMDHLSRARLDVSLRKRATVCGTQAEAVLSPHCLAVSGLMCHAHKSAQGHERGCPNVETVNCLCISPPADVCESPIVESLAIDPLTGHVYASANAGLLVSPDGGRVWKRSGGDANATYTRYDTAHPRGVQTHLNEPWAGDPSWLTPTSGVSLEQALAPLARGTQLLTFQGIQPVAPPNDENALDLNAQPEYLMSVARVSIAQYPCPAGSATTPFHDVLDHDRPRGQLVATVTATWINPVNPGTDAAPTALLSGVFLATRDTCAEANDAVNRLLPLVFRDTANFLSNQKMSTGSH